MRRFLTLLAVTVLAACGGSSGSDPAPVPAPLEPQGLIDLATAQAAFIPEGEALMKELEEIEGWGARPATARP